MKVSILARWTSKKEQPSTYHASLVTQKQLSFSLKRVSLLIVTSLIVDVDLDRLDRSGCSALFYAIKNGNEEIAFMLYCKGASIVAP